MNARTAQKQAIYEHGLKLQKLFGLEGDPDQLARKLYRIEVREHQRAEDECNGTATYNESVSETLDKLALDTIDLLTGFRAKGIPLRLNGDPRGHVLKIDVQWMNEHPECDLPRDWGGYGILAPDLS